MTGGSAEAQQLPDISDVRAKQVRAKFRSGLPRWMIWAEALLRRYFFVAVPIFVWLSFVSYVPEKRSPPPKSILMTLVSYLTDVLIIVGAYLFFIALERLRAGTETGRGQHRWGVVAVLIVFSIVLVGGGAWGNARLNPQPLVGTVAGWSIVGAVLLLLLVGTVFYVAFRRRSIGLPGRAIAAVCLLSGFVGIGATLDWGMSHLAPGMFCVQTANRCESTRGGALVPLSKGQAVYFAVTTFTTLGLGDVRPASDIGRSLVAVQSAAGFVAVGIGLVILLNGSDPPPGEGGTDRVKRRVLRGSLWRAVVHEMAKTDTRAGESATMAAFDAVWATWARLVAEARDHPGTQEKFRTAPSNADWDWVG